MSAQKKGLGKGLSALFGEIENKIDNKSNQKNTIAISDLERNKYQPRIIFDEEKLEELMEQMELENAEFPGDEND